MTLGQGDSSCDLLSAALELGVPAHFRGREIPGVFFFFNAEVVKGAQGARGTGGSAEIPWYSSWLDTRTPGWDGHGWAWLPALAPVRGLGLG